jgi:ribosomal protein S18 acetylase RimI-like enzyme
MWQGAYILNVVVDEDSRGQGVGKALMREAMSRAVSVIFVFIYM